MKIETRKVHGDYVADGLFYCRRCDEYVPAVHFVDHKVHPDGMAAHIRVYKDSLMKFNRAFRFAKRFRDTLLVRLNNGINLVGGGRL